MKHFNKILFGFCILFLVASGLSSCSIAIKAVYNHFSDKDEFVLFDGERRAKTADRKLETVDPKLETADRKFESGKGKMEEKKEWEADLMDGFVVDSL